MATSLPCPPGTSALFRMVRSRRWLAVLTALASLAAGCGGSQTTPTPTPTPSPSHPLSSASPSASSSPMRTSYCDPQDTTIPGAAAWLAGQGSRPNNLPPVPEAWLEMEASLVPACSEIVRDPPAVQTRNLTNGELGDAAFQTWVTEDEEWWTLVEWAQQHDQPDFITFLQGGVGGTLTTFVRAGGRVVDSQMCEYASKYDAVAVTGQQMADLTTNTQTGAGVVYVGAAVGPCTSTWTAANGTVTHKDIGSGQEGRELDVSTTATNPALGEFLLVGSSWPYGYGTTADGIMEQAGI